MGYFVYACVIVYVFGVLGVMPDLPIGGLTLHIISTTLFTAPLFVIIILKKQGIASIGLHTKKLWPALRLGLIFAAIALFSRHILHAVLGGWEVQPIDHIMFMLFMTATVAFMEDTVFSGYIQTRIYGLVKNDIAAVLIVAFLFALIHPVAFAGLRGPSAFLTQLLSVNMLTWMAAHVVHNLLFRRYFSLIPVLMLHMFWNFGSDGIFVPGEMTIPFIHFPVLIIAVAVWLIIVRLKARKATTESKEQT